MYCLLQVDDKVLFTNGDYSYLISLYFISYFMFFQQTNNGWCVSLDRVFWWNPQVCKPTHSI